MSNVEKKVIDLGSYKRFLMEDSIKDKLKTLVLDEGGLKSPISISVVIPTKMDLSSGSEREIEHKALHRVLSECSRLVDAGYIDEILVIDATTNENKDIDYSILKSVVSIAYEELELFRDQVNRLNKFKIENEKAKRGIYQFCFRVIHQFDANIDKIIAQSGVINYTGILRTLSGKGSGLWLTIPICSGDIICFVDSDIVNFQKEFIIGLCHPIIYSWNEVLNTPTIKMTKAYYNRLTISTLPDKELIVGGRTTRLFAIPLLEILTKNYNLFKGLETIKYPLSGEFAACREVLEKIEFPNNYAMEMSTLIQVSALTGPNTIANIDLENFYHIGQKSTALHKMAIQILTALKKYIPESISDIFSQSAFLDEYEKTAYRISQENENTIRQRIETIEEELKNKVKYSLEDDFKEIQNFKSDLTSFKDPNKTQEIKTTFLPSWDFLKTHAVKYDFLKILLSRRAIQSTWTRLKENELIT
jgi:guanylate kinase